MYKVCSGQPPCGEQGRDHGECLGVGGVGFPDVQVIKTLCFQCRGMQVWELRSYMLRVWSNNLTNKRKKVEEVGGRFKREGTYVYLWLIHVDVWQKPTQHCKAIIRQLKIKRKKRECLRGRAQE